MKSACLFGLAALILAACASKPDIRQYALTTQAAPQRAPPRLLRAPLVGPWLSSLSGLIGIAVAQIRAQRPDVLYCQDLWFLPRSEEHTSELQSH